MTRQHEHHKRLREAGWARKEIWLSPEDQKRLDVVAERYGSKSQAVRVMLEREVL